jgi:predicted lipoprotein
VGSRSSPLVGPEGRRPKAAGEGTPRSKQGRLVITLALLALAIATSGCRESRRKKILERLVTHVATPAYDDLATRSDALAAATRALVAAPDHPKLDAARARWREALVAWKTTFSFRPAALVKLAPHFRATFWPPERRLMDAVLADAKPIDAGLVGELGVSAKGMFALERLLFGGTPREKPAPAPPLEALSGEAGARRRAYLLALATDVAAAAHAARDVVAAPPTAAAFAADGQVALNRLVNDLVAVVENVVSDRLTFMAGAVPSGAVAWTPYEGDASASTQASAAALLHGVARLYDDGDGGGLGAIVKSTAPDADAPTRAALTSMLTSVDAIEGPLEDVARRDLERVKRAAADARAFEIALKTSVASALGVTLTFTAGDGD